MSFFADEFKHHKQWDYIIGDMKMSILTSRYYYLQKLNEQSTIKISIRNIENDRWTKWTEFPGGLFESHYSKFGDKTSRLSVPFDVHRSILTNEIVIESDYPTYQENFEAAQIAGKIFEHLGFSPLYYYSGNKSIHIHCFMDWNFLYILSDEIKKKLFDLFMDNVEKFKKDFILWLRAKMVSCWNTNAREFDSDLINATHLIRSEMSRNKMGYKTFLGYSYKDLSSVPRICNENNKIYPEIGKMRLSLPPNIMEILSEFIDYEINDRTIKKVERKVNAMRYHLDSSSPEEIRNCVKRILSNDFLELKDGSQRAMFILISELRRGMDDFKARIVVNDWNSRLTKSLPQSEIDYRFKKKAYKLSTSYIESFLSEMNL